LFTDEILLLLSFFKNFGTEYDYPVQYSYKNDVQDDELKKVKMKMGVILFLFF